MGNQKGKYVLVTGAGGNVGKAAVSRFHLDGYHVIAIVSPGKKAGYNGPAGIDVREADLADEQMTARIIGDVLTAYPTLHAALLTTGGYIGGSIKSTDGEKIRRMVTLNFETVYTVARPVFRHMQEHGGGRIVLFGARAPIVPSEGKNSLAYSLSKSLIFRLAEYLNAEGAPSNVIASVVVPSTIDTPQNREAMPSADFSKWVSPEDIAATMAFLCSDEGRSVREAVIKVYGG